jgi:eukaryotic-like serine/threonine-protein kinase
VKRSRPQACFRRFGRRELGETTLMAVGAEVLPERYAEPRLIGQGGMGEIYLARDRELGREVAIKLLDERFADDASLRRRFEREALTAARLSGEPHVVTIFDVGESHGRPFIVMEYLPGGTLGDRASARPVDPAQALDWLEQAAAALDAAHAAGIVHRDVKPANLLFDARGELQVADFGIARAVDDTAGGMTAAGTVLGTAGYLSPEQACGQPAAPASDRYALAIVAYELLTGGRPFQGGSATAEAAAHIHQPVPPASERGVGLPRPVDAVFERGLAKRPENRYGSAGDFVAALAAALGPGGETTRTRVIPAAAPPPRPVPQRRQSGLPVLVGVLLAAVLLAAGIVAALVATNGEDAPEPAPAPGRETVTQEVTIEGEPTTVTQEVTTPEEEPEPPAGASLTPTEAAALNDEAFVEHMQQGDYAEALPLLERAVPALRGTYSGDFQYEAYAEYNLGKTLAELDRCDEALPHLERSEELQGEKEPITQAKQQCGA